jgi:hypothetical protein
MPKPKTTVMPRGLRVSDIALPWEGEDEFVEIHEIARRVYKPQDQIEEDIVLDIARYLLKKRRFFRSTQIAYRRDPMAENLRVAVETGGPEALVSHLSRGVDQMRDSRKRVFEALPDYLDLVKAYRNAVLEMSNNVELMSDPVKWAAKKAECDFLATSAEAAKKLLLGLSDLAQLDDLDESVLARPYRSDVIERELKTEASIDKAIEKKIAALVRQKEFTRLYGGGSKQLPQGGIIDVEVNDTPPPLDSGDNAQASDPA